MDWRTVLIYAGIIGSVGLAFYFSREPAKWLLYYYSRRTKGRHPPFPTPKRIEYNPDDFKDPVQKLAAHIRTSTISIDDCTKLLYNCYRVESDDQTVKHFRRQLFSETRLYGECVHPRTLRLIEQLKDIADKYMYLDNPAVEREMYQSITRQWSKERGTSRELIRKYSKVRERMEVVSLAINEFGKDEVGIAYTAESLKYAMELLDGLVHEISKFLEDIVNEFKTLCITDGTNSRFDETPQQSSLHSSLRANGTGLLEACTQMLLIEMNNHIVLLSIEDEVTERYKREWDTSISSTQNDRVTEYSSLLSSAM